VSVFEDVDWDLWVLIAFYLGMIFVAMVLWEPWHDPSYHNLPTCKEVP
jgi:hypothetical protein